MSELANTLELFGFLTIDDVTSDSLKRSFKTRILEVHPDKGGNSDAFDTLLQSYVYLTETIQRISGGRATLQNILSPDELKRSDEIINRFFDEFQMDDFNQQFETQKKETHGYGSWLNDTTDESMTRIDEKDLHSIFENTYKGVTESIILHPEEMGYISGSNVGTALLDNHCYTSDIFSNPEYTDLYSAFTTNNIICNKINIHDIKNRSMDMLIEERKKEITPFNDIELKAIYDYEKRKNDVSKLQSNSFFIDI